jgi:hypothetical protein
MSTVRLARGDPDMMPAAGLLSLDVNPCEAVMLVDRGQKWRVKE